MKRLFFLSFAVFAMWQTCFADDFDFAAVAPSGQVLYYYIISNSSVPSVQVTRGCGGNQIGNLIIPDSVTHNGTTYIVTSIGGYAFHNCTGLTSVTLPSSVDTICPNTFQGCNNITTVNYSGTITQWCRIGFSNYRDNPIYYSHSLNINGVPVVNLVIPEGVSEIKQNSFGGLTSLMSVTLPNTVTSIGDNAFYQCTGLTSMALPNSVTYIGNYAFYQCTDLTSVTIPNTVTSIGRQAFYQCTGLTSVTIPNSVTIIGHSAFIYCTSVTSFTYGDKSLTVISNDTTKGTVHIIMPANLEYSNLFVEAKAEYNELAYTFVWSIGQSTSNPYSFTLSGNTVLTAIFSPIEYTLSVGSSNTLQGTVSGSGTYHYGDTATIVAIPHEHYHFIRWDDNSTINPRQIIILGNTNVIAFFAQDIHVVNVVPNDLSRGYVTQSGYEIVYGQDCTVFATPFAGYSFAGWSNGVLDNPYTFDVLSDVELTAMFIAEGEEVNIVTMESADPTMGNATVNGYNAAIVLNGDSVTIIATAFDGYRFVRWNDNDTHAVRTVIVTADATYTAYFESTTHGIEEVDGGEVRIYAADGRIHVIYADEPSALPEIRVYDLMGREVFHATHADETSAFPGGVYLVKVGTLPARKVVVIR